MSVSAIILASALPVFDFATNSIARRVEESDPAVCLSLFNDYPNCVRRSESFSISRSALSTNFWLKGVDFSCVSPWNDSCGIQRAGTLISKRHIIFAKHFPLWKGVRILFVGADGGVCPCYIDRTKEIPDSDVMIASLENEVTPNIHPAKILPEDYETFVGDGRGLPVAIFNQNREVFLADVSILTIIKGVSRSMGCKLPKVESHRRFNKRVGPGDSGCPAFILIGNEPILLLCLHRGGYGVGPLVHGYRKEIQTAMDELCPGYKLEEFDFQKVRCNDGK